MAEQQDPSPPAPDAPDTPGEATPEEIAALTGHAIVAGYGIPGRAVGDLLARQHTPFCVIELNPQTVRRLSRTPHKGVYLIVGDVSQEQTLLRAGIERASLFAVTVPVDAAVLEAVRIARRLNPGLRILARCRYVSTALEAARRGADEVVSEEQVVAREFAKLLGGEGGEGGEARGEG